MLIVSKCVMENKRRSIKLGQVWRRDYYHSGMSDNEYQGTGYYLVTGKQSMGRWKMKRIATDPKDLKIFHDRYSSYWIKGSEIRQDLFQVEDVEQFKAAIVLYG